MGESAAFCGVRGGLFASSILCVPRPLFGGQWQMKKLAYSILVLCREMLLREAITDALSSRGDVTVAGSMYLSANLSDELSIDPDIVVYVDTSGDQRNLERDVANAHLLKDARWIVLSNQSSGALISRLRELRTSISFAPLSITRHALAHVVALAACGHEVRIDDCREAAPSDERVQIMGAGLAPSQWKLLHHLALGLSNKEIARKESATINVIKVRVRTLLGRLNVANRTQAAVLIARAGLFEQSNLGRANVVELRRPTAEARVVTVQ